MKGAEVSAVQILFYALFKKTHKREIFGERVAVDLSRLEISTSQNRTTFMISELY
jgi:hypothetical protein